MNNLNTLITGAFFCYGMFTLQRPGFLMDFLPRLWKMFPKGLHEPLWSCGICVSSFWGLTYLLLSHYDLWIIIYPIAFCGICAILDRSVKYFEYGYKYNPVKPLANYSYLENMDFRNEIIEIFLRPAKNKEIHILEIGGHTESLDYYKRYKYFDKPQTDILNFYITIPCFYLIKGLAFEGSFDSFLSALQSPNCKGFIIEGSMSGESKKQLLWIQEAFPDLIKLPYIYDVNCEIPEHCAGSVSNRLFLINPTT